MAPNDDGNDDGEALRWEQERQSSDKCMYDAVGSLVGGGNVDGGWVFLKAKFSQLFDFDNNWETRTRMPKIDDEDVNNAEEPAKNKWKEKCRKLLDDIGVE